MAYQYIHAEEHGRVLVLRMDDPATRNSLRTEMSAELLTEIARFEKSPELRCLVITGTDPSFCAGANVGGLARSIERSEQQRQQQVEEEAPPLPWAALDARCTQRATDPVGDLGPGMVTTLMRLQKPSIAAINGYALGVGSGVALSCDIRIASERGSLAETFIQRGLPPGDGSCWQLPRMVGLSNTYLQAYTGDRVDAETALRWGLVSKVVPHDQLMPVTLELATRLANGPVYSMGLIKYLIQQSLNMTFEESLRLGRAALAVARATEDHKEGVRSFLEKRPPRFQGR